MPIFARGGGLPSREGRARRRGPGGAKGESAAVAVLLLALAFVPEAAARALVLVTAANNPPLELTFNEVQRAYMGRMLEKDGYRILPFRNASEDFLRRVFRQKVVYMSERHYNRLIVLRAQKGGWHPPAIRRPRDLLRVLDGPDYRIAYMWEREARSREGVRVLRELWRE